MAETPKKDAVTTVKSFLDRQNCDLKEDKMICERCGAEMYRMHAVWRCAGCGFKTDCCGW
jgi:ribosomal protein L37E